MISLSVGLTTSILSILFFGSCFGYLLARDIPHRILLGPVLFLAFLGLEGWVLAYSPWFHGTDRWVEAFAIQLLIIFALSIIRHPREWFHELFDTWSRTDCLLAFLLAGSSTLVFLIPYFMQPELTAISQGNNDVIHYSIIERHLQQFPIRCDEGITCTRREITSTVARAAPVYMLSAMLGSIAGLEPHRYQGLMMGILQFFLVFHTFFLCRRVWKMNHRHASWCTSLIGFHPLLLHSFGQVYKGQQLTWIFLVPLVWMTMELCEASPTTGKAAVRLFPPYLLLFFGAWSSYSHMALPTICILAFIILVDAVPRRLRSVSYLLIVLFFSAYATCLVLWKRGYGPVGQLISKGQAAKELFLPPVALDGLFGGLWPAAFVGMSPWPETILRSIPYLIFALLGLHVAYTRNRVLFRRAIGMIAFAAVTYLYLLFYRITETGQVGGYQSFKWLLFLLPVLLPALCLAPLRGGAASRVVTSIMFLFLAVEAATTAAWVRTQSTSARVIPTELLSLDRFGSDTRIDSVNILDTSYWGQLWSIYFLFRKDLYLAVPTYYGASSALKGDWDLATIEEGWIPAEAIHVEGTLWLIKRTTELNSSLSR